MLLSVVTGLVRTVMELAPMGSLLRRSRSNRAGQRRRRMSEQEAASPVGTLVQ
jgi:hypothetical protein